MHISPTELFNLGVVRSPFNKLPNSLMGWIEQVIRTKLESKLCDTRTPKYVVNTCDTTILIGIHEEVQER